MPLQDLPAELRPREKLLARGPAALADAELLALLLRTGTAGQGVLEMAQALLARFGGLAGLMQASLADLKTVKGLGGTAKRAELAAVLEIARRSMAQQLAERPVIDSPAAVKEYVRLRLGGLTHEVFAVMFLDVRHHLLCMEEMFRGSLSQASTVYTRKSFQPGSALH